MAINFKFWDNSLEMKEGIHYVNGRSLKGPFPVGLESAMFGMGCFWGVEKVTIRYLHFWPIYERLKNVTYNRSIRHTIKQSIRQLPNLYKD